jgi:hypothetical protein
MEPVYGVARNGQSIGVPLARTMGFGAENGIMTEMVPVVAAAGYSMMYLLGGGGIVGALVIFVVAKMFGK